MEIEMENLDLGTLGGGKRLCLKSNLHFLHYTKIVHGVCHLKS